MIRAMQCAGRRGASTGASYRSAFSSLGVEYVVEGVFERASARLLQLELVTPAQRASAVRDLFTRWVSQVRSAAPTSELRQ
jgi:hypothetical protein